MTNFNPKLIAKIFYICVAAFFFLILPVSRVIWHYNNNEIEAKIVKIENESVVVENKRGNLFVVDYDEKYKISEVVNVTIPFGILFQSDSYNKEPPLLISFGGFILGMMFVIFCFASFILFFSGISWAFDIPASEDVPF